VVGLTIGNVTVDDLVFPDGRTKMGVPGGDAVYSGIGARMWGIDTHICSICGPDYPMDTLSREYRLNVDSIRRIKEPSMRNWGLYEDDGSRLFVIRDRGLTWSDYSPLPDDLPRELAAGVPTHIAVLPWEHQIQLAQTLRKLGTPMITLDPDYGYMGKKPVEEIALLLRNIDVFLPSWQEAVALFPEKDPECILERYVDEFPSLKAIVIKLGADGSIAYDRTTHRAFRVPAYHASVVDPTGAGDAFCGGFLAGAALGQDIVECVLFGTVSSSFVIEQFGTLGLGQTARRELEERLESLRSRVSFI